MDMTSYFLGRNAAGNSSSGADFNIVEPATDETFEDTDIYNANGMNVVINGIFEMIDGMMPTLSDLVAESISDCERTYNKTKWVDQNSGENLYPTAKAVYEYGQRIAQSRQEILVSGENIKTINGQSVLGKGDIPIEGGSSSGSNWTVKEKTYTIEGGESGTSGSFALTPQTPSVSNFTEAYFWAKVSSTVSGTHRINFDNARTQIVSSLQIGTTPSRLAIHIIKIGDILYVQKVNDVTTKAYVVFTSDTTLGLRTHWSTLAANQVITSVGGIMYR